MCPSTNRKRKCERKRKRERERDTHTYLMEYSAIKKNEMMLLAGKWMELAISMLSEINQTQKDKYCMFSLICGI
jgi:hypothetical protein